MKHCLLTLALLLIATGTLRAQEGDKEDWHVRLSTGMGVSSSMGQTQTLNWVAPSFEFHPSKRLTVNTGFAAVGSLMPDGYKLQGLHNRSLAPLRGGTQATALWAEASYSINPRLWVWGAVAHVGGFAQPLWLGQSLPLQATAFSGGFGYRFGERSILEMHIHIVRDRYGTLAPLLYSDPFSLNHYNHFF